MQIVNRPVKSLRTKMFSNLIQAFFYEEYMGIEESKKRF